MASAGISSSRRAVLMLRLEVTRLSAKTKFSTMTATCLIYNRHISNLNYHAEYRSWWNACRRGLTTSTKKYTPCFSHVFHKEHRHHKESKDQKATKDGKNSESSKESYEKSQAEKVKIEASGKDAHRVSLDAADVQVMYDKGLPRIIVPLPSRQEKCIFLLKPITHTVGDFLDMLRKEDSGILETNVTTIDNLKLASNTTIETLLKDKFILVVNDKNYTVSPPPHIDRPKESLQNLEEVKALVCQLYEAFDAREHHVSMEREIMMQLEEVQMELEPMEKQRLEIEETAARRSHIASWVGLVMMSIQFGILARLTWWEYSWDIMEPVTYFVTYGTAMACYIYFLLTRQEYMLPDVFTRQHLLVLHKKARKNGFDLVRYNQLKDEAYHLETMLRIVRGPLHTHKCLVEQKRKERMDRKSSLSSSRSSSSSSSSKSPSSSPSPSPSPQRDVKKSNAQKATSSGPVPSSA